jgi:hypothetical protein
MQMWMEDRRQGSVTTVARYPVDLQVEIAKTSIAKRPESDETERCYTRLSELEGDLRAEVEKSCVAVRGRVQERR